VMEVSLREAHQGNNNTGNISIRRRAFFFLSSSSQSLLRRCIHVLLSHGWG